jgi:predicted nucleic acid-binding protein
VVTAYLDASVILRVVLGEPNRLPEWPRITTAVSSELVRVECLRVFDRLRIIGALDDGELARRRSTLLDLLTGFDLVRINRPVLDRSSEPFPTLVRTLDALHVASALLVRSRYRAMRFATHDQDLATAALAFGFRVIGSG